MREILRTNDAVLLSFLESLFREAEVHFLVADVHMSIVEGSIGAFPRRFMVLDDDVATARQLIADAGLAHELVPEGRLAIPPARLSDPDPPPEDSR